MSTYEPLGAMIQQLCIVPTHSFPTRTSDELRRLAKVGPAPYRQLESGRAVAAIRRLTTALLALGILRTGTHGNAVLPRFVALPSFRIFLALARPSFTHSTCKNPTKNFVTWPQNMNRQRYVNPMLRYQCSGEVKILTVGVSVRVPTV